MSISKENGSDHFIPPMLDSQLAQAQADILNSFGLKYRQPDLYRSGRLREATTIVKGLWAFAEDVNREKISQLVQSHLKNGQSLADQLFRLIPITHLGHNFLDSPENFCADEQYGFLLGKEEENPLWLAGVTFQLPYYQAINTGPTIIQLQAFSYIIPEDMQDQRRICQILTRKAEAVKTLQQMRWEFFLVDVVMEWAMKVGFPVVYLQPGSQNLYTKSDHGQPLLPPERAYLRYDVTAKRYGFKMDPQTGWYALYPSY